MFPIIALLIDLPMLYIRSHITFNIFHSNSSLFYHFIFESAWAYKVCSYKSKIPIMWKLMNDSSRTTIVSQKPEGNVISGKRVWIDTWYEFYATT